MSAGLANLVHTVCTVLAVFAVRRRQRAGGCPTPSTSGRWCHYFVGGVLLLARLVQARLTIGARDRHLTGPTDQNA